MASSWRRVPETSVSRDTGTLQEWAYVPTADAYADG
jgi:hypothetical protein